MRVLPHRQHDASAHAGTGFRAPSLHSRNEAIAQGGHMTGSEFLGEAGRRGCSSRLRKTLLLTLLAATALTVPGMAYAQTTQWTGAVDGDWFDPANWTQGVPTASVGTFVQGEGTAPVIDGGAAFAHELYFGGAVSSTLTGSLTIMNGGTLESDVTVIALDVGTDYTLTVTGDGSSWQTFWTNSGVQAGPTAIGSGGIGRLNILDGADVIGDGARVGAGPISEGYVLVDGAGSTWTMTQTPQDALTVGYYDYGELIVSDGGVVTTSVGRIGELDGSLGEVTVTGDGSQWNATFGLYVGRLGEAQLSVLDGGAVNASAAFIGAGADGEGSVLVSGADSALNLSGVLYVGYIGDPSDLATGELTIADGGTVTVDGGAGTVFVDFGGNTTTGILNIGARAGDPAAAPGTLNAALVNLIGDGYLIFNHTGADYDFSAPVAGGVDTVIENLAGTTILSGDHPLFFGFVGVGGGTLLVDGALGANTGIFAEVYGGGTLGGNGTFRGDVSVGNGTLAPGSSVGTLTISSDLSLSANSILEFELGNPGGVPGVDSDLIEVGNNLTLDGTLNVIDAGGFGAGTYRLSNYGGVLTDNGLDIGTVPAGFTAADLTVLTATVGQVDLLVGGSSTTFAFWDGNNTTPNGTVDGGAGTWTAISTNWTDASGSANGAYDPSAFLIFQNTGGTVFIDSSDGPITVANGMQFAVDGYVIVGSNVTLSGATTFRVGDGTGAGANFTAMMASSLVGTGSLEKTDLGTLILDGFNNTYSGGTIVTGGTLVGNADTLQGDILNNARLVFDQDTADGFFSDALTGTGQTLKEGDFRLVLSGDSSAYAGTTEALAGTLSVSGELGGSIAVASGATLGGSGTVGTVSVDGGGTLAPGFAPNTVPGTLTILGDLTLSAASMLDFELGDPAGTPGVDSDLIEVGGDLTLDGILNVTDAGGFGDGTYRLINYGGTLTDNGLDIGIAPAGYTAADLAVLTATQGQIDLLVGVTSTSFAFWDGSNTTANGVIDGGDGTWTATATNWTDTSGSANGPYDPSAFLIFQGAGGSVLVDNGGGAITVANGMQFAVDGYSIDGDDITLSGAATFRVGDGTLAGEAYVAVIGANLVGSGSLQKTDLGILTLSGTNSYTGGTTVTGGTLLGDATSLQGNIVNNAELIFRQEAADGIYGDALSGSGRTVKEGDFALTLSGNSSGYTGTTDILAGTLFLEDELGGAISVFSGATLGGNGQSGGSITVGPGGTLAPGSSIGTLTVEPSGGGGVTFDAGSIYEVELNDGGNGAGTNNDLLAVAGTVTINGGTVHVTPENGTDDGTTYTVGSQYTIILAEDGVTGTFSALTDDYAFLDFLLSYDATNVYLTSQMALTTFCLDGMTPNQCATGDGVFSLGSGTLWTAVLNLPDDEAPAALDQLSGEVHASAKAALIEDSRFPREAALDRLRVAFGSVGADGNGMAERRVTGGFAFWGRAFGSWGNWDGDGNAAAFDRSIGGIFLGGDALVTDTLRLGVFGGYGASSFDAEERNSSGSADTWHLGVYGGAELGKLGLRFGGAYAWHDVETARSAAFTGFSDSLLGGYDARTGQVFGEVGYRFDHGAVRFEPFAGLAYVNLHTDGYAEAGGEAALTGGSRSMDTTFTTIGVRAETEISLGGATTRLGGMAGWRHAFGDVTPFTTHAFTGGDSFTVSGVPIAKDAFVLDLGVAMNLTPDAVLGVSYSSQFGSGFTDQGLKANFAVRF